MRFVANLRQETISAFAKHETEVAAYLLSSHRVTAASLKAAREVRALGVPLFADNGTKPLIEATIARFESDAKQIRLKVTTLRRTLGEVPRGAAVPADLRDRASALANEVVEFATGISEAINTDLLIATQLEMHPTDLIAQEDFATGALIGLGLERETTGWTVGQFDRRNRRSLALWRRVAEDPRCADVRVYAVLSAMDYNTARSAGRLAAAAGVSHAAIGFAGVMLDGSATDFMVFGTGSVTLERPAPRRYVRLAQVLRGISDGYADTGKALERFHCLGLGAPAVFPIVAAALSETGMITTDATSPIHDAVRDRVLYDATNDGARATTREIVSRIVNGEEWRFVSPFSIAFRDEFGHDPAAARAAWEAFGRPPITNAMLETPGALATALPLFSDADPATKGAVGRVRIAHNHWVLGQICETYPDGPGRLPVALATLDRLCSGPATVTTRALEVARAVVTR